MPSTQNKITTKIDALTGVRGVAALWVAYFHISHFWIPTLPVFSFKTIGPLEPLMNRGYLGVDLFFILSGFVISYVYKDSLAKFSSAGMKRFLLLRVARIFPVHYATILLCALVNFGIPDLLNPESELFGPLPLLYNLLNIQDWEVSRTLTWNYPAWSVSAEWLLYLLFPFINLLLCKIRGLFVNLLLIAAAIGLLATVGSTQNLGNLDWTVHLGIVRAFFEFLVGYGLNSMFQEVQRRKLKLVVASSDWIALSCLVISTGCVYASPDVPDILLVCTLAAFIGSVALSTGICRRIFAGPILVFLGEVSYSIYMLHYLVQSVFFFKLPIKSIDNMLLPNLSIIVTVAAATLMYYGVERPARNAIRGFAS